LHKPSFYFLCNNLSAKLNDRALHGIV